jgi:hypothetical protein
MSYLNESIIAGRLYRDSDEIETNLMYGGAIIQTLPLKCSTTLSREVMPDGTYGPIKISNLESMGIFSGSSVYMHYMLVDGKLVYDRDYLDVDIEPTIIRRLSLLAKIAISRVDHWEKETDFYGTYEYED